VIKFVKRTIKLALLLCVLTVGITFVNNETDLLSEFSRYMPEFGWAENVENFSKKLSEYTGDWPTFEQMYASVEKSIRGSEDIAVNEYIKDSPMLSFYTDETIGVKTEVDSVTLYGKVSDEEKVNFIAIFSDSEGNKLSQTSFAVDFDNEFSKKLSYPETESNRLELSVYYCPKAYGEYRSWVIEYLYFERDVSGFWALSKSDVYENNISLYETEKSIKNSTSSSSDIVSDNTDLIRFTSEIVKGAESDYDKLLAIHNWICDNIYYDEDAVKKGEFPSYNPIEVINSRRAVCKGYAYLFAAMARSQGIGCTIVSGYALGIDGKYDWRSVGETKTQNHAWNEAYADGRWVIIDTTWDCGNKIENNKLISDGTSHIYFDANLKYFSANHKIMQYIYR